ncbi:MAG: cytochrome C biogenesis protein [bacterium]|nr:cytochrome C biogenesis protein [bacterium]
MSGLHELYKLEIFIPESHLAVLRSTLQAADAGHIGNYDSCLAFSRVTGTWRPLDGAHPYIGTGGAVSEESEIKVEVNVKGSNLKRTLQAIKSVHPYEEPLINIIPLFTFDNIAD